MKVNLQQIAAESGYSLSTVSRALNDSDKVAAKAKQEILACAHRCGYWKDRGVIAILLPSWNMEDMFFRETIHEALAELSAHEYNVMLIPDNSLTMLKTVNVAGAISMISQAGIEQWWDSTHTRPLIVLNGKPNHIDNICTVISDDDNGIGQLVSHLAELGHRKIAYIGYGFSVLHHYENRRRLDAFQNHCRAHYLRDDLFRDVNDDRNLEYAVLELLKEKPTAYIAACELAPMKVIHTLTKMGYQVPRDISVTGICLETIDPYVIPAVTGIHQNLPELARQAVGKLIRMLAGDAVTRDTLVPYLLHLRASTASAAEDISRER